jgi:hypothetical protein
LRLIVSGMPGPKWNWGEVSRLMKGDAPKSRNSKQCRERWYNHLDPTVSHVEFTEDEIMKLLNVWRKYHCIFIYYRVALTLSFPTNSFQHSAFTSLVETLHKQLSLVKRRK